MSETVSSSSSDALEGFQLLIKTSTGKQCVMVLKQVLKDSRIFVFGELLELQNIKDVSRNETTDHIVKNKKESFGFFLISLFAVLLLLLYRFSFALILFTFLFFSFLILSVQLAGTENAGWLELLRLFAYGSYKDYKGKNTNREQTKTEKQTNNTYILSFQFFTLSTM